MEKRVFKCGYDAPQIESVEVAVELGVAVSGEVLIEDPEVSNEFKDSFWN